MAHYVISDMADCSEFRQTLTARPPIVVHGSVILLSMLVVGAVAWAACTQVNLVVMAKGRIRSEDIPLRVFTSVGLENAGRVVFAPYDEGAVVHKGEILVRLDTSRIEILIAKINRNIEGCESELANLAKQQELLEAQTLAATEKSRSELLMAEAEIEQARLKRASEIRGSEAEVQIAAEQVQRLKKLQQNQAASRQELEEAEAKSLVVREKLVQAQLPLSSANIRVAQQALELVTRELAVRKAELESRIVTKQSEKESLAKDLADLKMQQGAAVLVAPEDGVIVSGRIRVGDMLEAGKPVYELARPDNSCFEAVVSANDVADVAIGLPVRMRLDAYDHQKYGTLSGKVSYISPDSKPLDAAQATTPGKSTIAQSATFTIRVQFDAQQVHVNQASVQAKLGLTGTAEIVTESESLLSVLLQHIRRTISLN